MTNPKHTDTSRSGDLVERLRSPGAVFYEYGADKGALLHSCADRIEALEAENERLRRVLARWQYSGCPNCSGDCGSANPPVTSCIMDETRAALGEKQ